MVLGVAICDEVHKIKSLSCNEVLHLPQAMEPASIQEVCKGEGVGKEELPTQVPLLGIEGLH